MTSLGEYSSVGSFAMVVSLMWMGVGMGVLTIARGLESVFQSL